MRWLRKFRIRMHNASVAPWDRLNEDGTRIYVGGNKPFDNAYWRWYGNG